MQTTNTNMFVIFIYSAEQNHGSIWGSLNMCEESESMFSSDSSGSSFWNIDCRCFYTRPLLSLCILVIRACCLQISATTETVAFGSATDALCSHSNNSLCQHRRALLAFCWHYLSWSIFPWLYKTNLCLRSRFLPFNLSYSLQHYTKWTTVVPTETAVCLGRLTRSAKAPTCDRVSVPIRKTVIFYFWDGVFANVELVLKQVSPLK